MELTIACVLRSGGPYDLEYVERLKDGVAEHLTLPHRFVCLADVELPDGVPLLHDWPGYWSKIELFRPGLLTGHIVYLDLDTVVVGDFSPLVTGAFGMIDDWLDPTIGASGVMTWTPTSATEHIYRSFVRDAAGAMASHRNDQTWISRSISWLPLRRWYPGRIVSRWWECIDGVPDSAWLVCFHGSPRPRDIGWRLVGFPPERRYGYPGGPTLAEIT